MNRISIKDILKTGSLNEDYLVSGWVRNKRGSKSIAFIMLNDGSCIKDLQIIIEDNKLLNKVFKNEVLLIHGQYKEKENGTS